MTHLGSLLSAVFYYTVYSDTSENNGQGFFRKNVVADSRVAAACGLHRQKELIKRLAPLCLVSNVREEINEINFRFVQKESPSSKLALTGRLRTWGRLRGRGSPPSWSKHLIWFHPTTLVGNVKGRILHPGPAVCLEKVWFLLFIFRELHLAPCFQLHALNCCFFWTFSMLGRSAVPSVTSQRALLKQEKSNQNKGCLWQSVKKWFFFFMLRNLQLSGLFLEN